MNIVGDFDVREMLQASKVLLKFHHGVTTAPMRRVTWRTGPKVRAQQLAGFPSARRLKIELIGPALTFRFQVGISVRKLTKRESKLYVYASLLGSPNGA